MTKLSPHFSLEEFTASSHARNGITNDLPLELREAAIRTCLGLERVRVILNANAIHITSGYRCKAINDAVGSKDTSQHMKGEAADFICPTFGAPDRIMDALVNSTLDYDQLILEFGAWVHISFSGAPRRQALIIDNLGTRPFL